MLHASCVARGERAIALVGKSRSGKSTLAAMVAQRGLCLVSDGMTLFDPQTGSLWIGSGHCKLSDESIEQLGLRPADYPHVTEERLKRYVNAPGPPSPMRFEAFRCLRGR